MELKLFIETLVKENLENFELVKGGKQRTVGDLIESKIVEIIKSAENDLISEKILARGKKSIEDVTIVSNGVKFFLDPKTRNVNSKFSMPNLTSIEKLKKLYNSSVDELIYIFVDYKISENIIIIEDVKSYFLWELDSSILGVGNLGNGQLQIKDAKKEIVIFDKDKDEWFLEFKKLVRKFLLKRLEKIQQQLLEWE
jgi:hypothetical protein